jgi:cholesterol transport system auxiliary component
MKKMLRFVPSILMALTAAITIACSTTGVQEQVLYDFGPLRAQSSGATLALPPISVADVNAPAWLDSTRMVYRLAYANDQQMRSYANSRWTMPPARLFEQRLKARIAQAGGAVLSMTDGVSNIPIIRVDTEEFSHVFVSATNSAAHVTVRVSVLRGHSLLAQKTFMRKSAAPTADASGGAVALAVASDVIISEMLDWLAKQPLK